MCSRLGALLLCTALVGCIVSDDPREGGLLGYVVKGEKGYKQRMARQTAIREHVVADLDLQKRQAQELAHRSAMRQQELEYHLAALLQLESQLDELERATAGAPANAALQTDVEAGKTSLAELRAEVAASPPTTATREKLDRLRAEVASLTNRVRLLLETQ